MQWSFKNLVDGHGNRKLQACRAQQIARTGMIRPDQGRKSLIGHSGLWNFQSSREVTVQASGDTHPAEGNGEAAEFQKVARLLEMEGGVECLEVAGHLGDHDVEHGHVVLQPQQLVQPREHLR